MNQHASGPENAVHYYRRDADTGAKPSGSFLGAFVRHSGVKAFYCQSRDGADYDDFVSRVTRADSDGRPCHYVAPGDAHGFEPAPVLRLAGAGVAPLMWRRRTLGQRRYSVIGEVTDLGAAETHRQLGDLLIAPAQPWDALIFPSKTVKAAAERIIDQHAAYLSHRLGGQPKLDGLHFVIPPGIDTQRYADTDDSRVMRVGVRRRLGIRDDDLCVLTTGNFAFHERAHPTPLYLALEAAARRSGVRVHLLQAGWFATERIEKAYRDAVREFAPAVNAIFLDGREPDIRERVWFAADVYAAFDDSVRHGLDTELCEAMAAGLPIVATDWGANRDVVRAGQEGYLIPTWLPLPESGGDLSLAPENAISRTDEARADTFMSGTLGQMTAIDLRAAAEAFEALAGNPDRRQAMGEAARRRARETYDWQMIIRRHQALWTQLRMIRADAAEVAPPVPGRAAVPLGDDPFSAYAPFATHTIREGTLVTLAKGLKDGEGVHARLERLRDNAINDIAAHALLDPAEQEHVLEHLSERDGVEVLALAELLSERRRYRLPRTLSWLAKMGVVRLIASDADEPAEDGRKKPTAGSASLVELGMAARRRGANDAALEYFRSALHQRPDDADANLHLGELLAGGNDLDSAVQHFAQAVEGDPKSVQARLDLGKALFLKGEHSEGIAALQAAAELAPENPEAHYLLGAAYRRAGAVDEAIRHLETSLKLRPKRADALCHLGYARKSAGRRAEALQAFRDTLKADPANLYAKAGEMSLGAERDGKRLFERKAGTRRVALHFANPAQFAPLADLFGKLNGEHWPLITSDGLELQQFQPDVVVVAGLQASDVRALVPNAMIVAAPAFLASQNRYRRAFAAADAVCAPGQVLAETWARTGAAEPQKIHITGYLPLDPLFRGDRLTMPVALRGVERCVLYAPSHRPLLSSAPLLGDDVVRRVRGHREDVTLVIKPHPETFTQAPQWVQQWRDAAKTAGRVIVVDQPDMPPLPLLEAADVLVSDASSIAFEFLAVGRPMVLIANREHARDVDAYDPQGIEWRWRDIAEEVREPERLAAAVERALREPENGAEIRDRCRDLLFGDWQDGAAAERIVALIGELST